VGGWRLDPKLNFEAGVQFFLFSGAAAVLLIT
jgi:hypothetical protein